MSSSLGKKLKTKKENSPSKGSSLKTSKNMKKIMKTNSSNSPRVKVSRRCLKLLRSQAKVWPQ